MTYDVAIIGGGLIGLMSARALVEHGLRVVIVEKGKIGHEASRAGGGILSALPPWYESTAALALQTWSQQHYPEICDDLLQHSGVNCGYTRSGMLVLAPQQDERFSDWKSHNLSTTIELTRQAVQQTYPGLGVVEDAVLLQQVAHMNNSRLIQALTQYLQDRGVDLLEDTAVSDLTISNQAVCGLLTSNDTIQANQYLLAAGAWSGDKHWQVGVPVKPIRGQMLAYECPEQLIEQIILYQGKYLIPKDNRLIVGSTLEDVGFNKATTQQGRDQLVEFAETVLPELKPSQPVQHWAGLRPFADREQPIICRHPEIKNYYINTGHYRNGILSAPASGQLVCDLMLGNTSILDPDPYQV